jgi:curved DNA-binding protein CbpA
MTTLYDLLGAHPDNDAASLKSAFRNAVKASHPDLHMSDPQALSRFRQIVRANAILSDAEQRKVYDHMLEFERWRLRAKSKRGIIADTMRKLASDAIAIAIVAVSLSGGYALFVRLSQESKRPVAIKAVDTAGLDPIETAPVNSERQAVPMSRQMLHELLSGSGGSGEAIVPSPPAPAANDGGTRQIATTGPASEVTNVVPPPDIAETAPGPEIAKSQPASSLPSRNPQFYRERATASYRNGDLDGALADFGRAILLDPSSARAYIDRGIVLYRKAEVDRAFADMAEAIRIETSRRASLRASPAPAKPPKASAVLSRN